MDSDLVFACGRILLVRVRGAVIRVLVSRNVLNPFHDDSDQTLRILGMQVQNQSDRNVITASGNQEPRHVHDEDVIVAQGSHAYVIDQPPTVRYHKAANHHQQPPIVFH